MAKAMPSKLNEYIKKYNEIKYLQFHGKVGLKKLPK
jgi:hypothetical protein